MTTITFEDNLNLDKQSFKNLWDFKLYLDENTTFTELNLLDKSEYTDEIFEKMKQTQKLPDSEFVNL